MTGTDGRPEICSTTFGDGEGPDRGRSEYGGMNVWQLCRHGDPAARCPRSGAEQGFGEQLLYWA